MFYNAAQDVDDVSCLMRDYIAIKIPKPTLEASIFADRDRARGLNHTLDMIQPPTYSLASGLCLCQCPQLPRGVTRVKHLISSYLVPLSLRLV